MAVALWKGPEELKLTDQRPLQEKALFKDHDHATCVASGLAAAERHCISNSLRLTPVRKRVLSILLSAHRAWGAYEILELLRAEGLGHQPPVAYRALDFLVKHGLAHKIESKNAYIACGHPTEDHTPAFLICHSCDHVEEGTAPDAAAFSMAAGSGFQVDRTVLEIEGVCPACQRLDDA